VRSSSSIFLNLIHAYRLPLKKRRMDLRGWDERYRTQPGDECVTPLLARTSQSLVPGRALDLACGAGRNALWLASRGWQVTAVDGSSVAIEILSARNPAIDARVADLEKHEYMIQPDSWDLIAICYYLQRDLFEPAKRGVVPGGIVLASAHIPEPADPHMTPFRLAPGELAGYHKDFEILHQYEGPSHDPAHRRWVAEIVARRPGVR
jgi:tellurite methyltransferase